MTVTWHTREELIVQLVTLHRQGLSRRAISRVLGISRNTVRVLCAAHGAARETEHQALAKPPLRAPRASKVDAYQVRVAELLRQYPDITAQRVFETLREEGFTGGYTAVKKYVRRLRPPPRPQPSLTAPEYGPGEMAENDWSPYDVTFADGHKEIIQAFSYVLVYSHRKSFELYRHADLHALMDGHVQAFTRFGGAERSFLNGRPFVDFEDMRAQLAHWLDTIVDPRRRHGQTALDRFAREREHLVPLPRHPYDTARVVYRISTLDGFVAWEGNAYAVPYDHVTDLLPVRITQRELFVYAADLSCVARHELAPRGQGLRLDPAGLHPKPGRQTPIVLDLLRIAFERMGELARRFFRLMSAGPPRLWGHQARQILLLRERFSTADLDAALGHAATFGAFEHLAIERILAARATPRSLDEYVA